MDGLMIPAGKAMGCLPRAEPFGELCSAFSEKIEVIPKARWKEFIGKVSLRPQVNVVLDQDGVGSCATESTAGADMIVRTSAGLPHVLLNPWSIYRVTSGGRDVGSSIDTNLAFARDTGILPESYWPRSKGWRATPPSGWENEAAKYKIVEFFDIKNAEEVGSALLKGFPVVFGWSGHSCVLTTLLSETTAEYLNSWGDWGDQGFGKVNLSAINYGYGAFAVRVPKQLPRRFCDEGNSSFVRYPVGSRRVQSDDCPGCRAGSRGAAGPGRARRRCWQVSNKRG